MAIPDGGQRPFPAVAIVALLFLVCLFPGQLWIARLLPGIAGLAKIKLSLIIPGVFVSMPATVDLILVPGLFISIYLIALFIYAALLGGSAWREIAQRLWAVFSGLFMLLFCVALGGLISYLVLDYLPGNVQHGLDSIGVNSEIYLPGYKAAYLHGNIVPLVCLIIGVVLCIVKIKKRPIMREPAMKLTREQRMTPYQRMLRERREQENMPLSTGHRSFADDRPYTGVRRSPLCHIQPLRTIKPEAVNYTPL